MLRCAKGCQGLCSAPGNPTVRCSRDSLKCGLCAPVSTAAAAVDRVVVGVIKCQNMDFLRKVIIAQTESADVQIDCKSCCRKRYSPA